MSSRNDDPKTPPEKENNGGSSFAHMDDIELGIVPPPPTELDLSRLDETKIAKREMEKNKPIRPDWLWEKRADGSYEYWTRGKVVIRAYIDHLERSGKDARRKMDEVIFTLRGKTGTASKRAEYAVEQITKIMAMLDVELVVKHELPCIWPNDDRVKCNGYRDGNCAMPIRREEICKDIPKDPIGEEGEELAPKEKRHPAILDGPEIAIRREINRADGPKSPCCGVAMVWINAKQHHICPNCGKPPGKKKCECHEGKSLGPGWPKCPYCGGELYTEELKEPEIHPEILKASRRDGTAHYSTEDGQQYLVTFVGLKETEYDGPDISLDEPEDDTKDDDSYLIEMSDHPDDHLEEPNSPPKVTPAQRSHLLNEDDDEAHAVAYYRPPIGEITPVVEWPDTDECPLSHEKHPECEGCNIEGGCTRGEHILRHRKMEEGEPTTILCPQCKQPVNRTYDHVKGGVGGGATGHYECPDPPEEQKDPFTELVESRYGSPKESGVPNPFPCPEVDTCKDKDELDCDGHGTAGVAPDHPCRIWARHHHDALVKAGEDPYTIAKWDGDGNVTYHDREPEEGK